MKHPLKIRCFLHASFEGPGVIADWAKEHACKMEYSRLFAGDPLPDPNQVDMLVIMGGPMSVSDYHIHPWIEDEIDWTSAFTGTGKPVIGICLGAQIVAAALGADVYPGTHKEIGWYNLRFLPSFGDFRIRRDLPAVRKVFHWHGDTFSIPEGAARIAESKAFANQGFILNGRVVALQFHLEVTPGSVKALVDHCGEDLIEGPFIQTAGELLEETGEYRENQLLMYSILDFLAGFITGEK